MFGFFREVFSVVSKRGWWLVVLNWLFFSFVVVGSLLGGLARFGQVYPLPVAVASPFEQSSPLLLFGFIFGFNLVISGFAFITLTGLAFFALSPILLCFRGFLWGVLFAGSSTPRFLAILPTVVLEGEGYVFAALAGVLLGLSWIKPHCTYREESLSRSQALRKSLRDSIHIYALIMIFLLAAAAVETITLLYV